MRTQYTEEQKDKMAKQAILAVLALGFEAKTFKNYVWGAMHAVHNPDGDFEHTPIYEMVLAELEKIKGL